MSPGNKNILAVNGGSSSIKFSVYDTGPQARPDTGGQPLRKTLSGKIERIGEGNAALTYTNSRNKNKGQLPVKAPDLSSAGIFLLGWLEKQAGVFPLAAVGHRVVHGGSRTEASAVDEALLDDLQRLTVYDPDHLPGEIELMRLIRRQYPGLLQIACFDTAFHTTLPPVARMLPIPRRYAQAGMQRYGFHGLSYAYILTELMRIAGPEVAMGPVIVAHLGSGASLAAIRDGVSIDTTMGFTPAGGIVMGTRPGDLDPGVLWAILDRERYSPEQLDHFINHQCGLLGVSETSSDMQELLALESSDSRAADAVALFCYEVRKAIGAFSAVLGGLDALVFTGGIGERSSVIRSRICAGLGYLGIGLDQRANAAGQVALSTAEMRTRVYAIPTDEEWMIATIVNQVL
ncbi:MAG TPA: acetate/propionate family kinase [Puia sp.]|nr:acetate/propionate family kinase [Puia sp.]